MFPDIEFSSVYSQDLRWPNSYKQNGSINLAQYKPLLSSGQLRKVNVGLYVTIILQRTVQELLMRMCMWLKRLENYFVAEE